MDTTTIESYLMKIFITGASGFIGSHLVPRLSADHDVTSLRCDLMDFAQVEKEILECQPDIIVHLAARTEVQQSFYEQITFSQINYVGSINLIEAAAKLSNLKRFIFASTMEVYGWQPISDVIRQQEHAAEIEVFDENTVPHPNAPYAVAKFAVEKYLEYMYRSKGFPFYALRQTNSYGRRDNNFFVMEQIISQMLENPQEINLGYPTPYRNFLWIGDLIDAWIELINHGDAAHNQRIFTLGPNNAIQIKHLAGKIAEQLGWQGQINWNRKPKRPGEIYLLNSDHTLFSKITGWQPKVNLDQGIDLTIGIWQEILHKKSVRRAI